MRHAPLPSHAPLHPGGHDPLPGTPAPAPAHPCPPPLPAQPSSPNMMLPPVMLAADTESAKHAYQFWFDSCQCRGGMSSQPLTILLQSQQACVSSSVQLLQHASISDDNSLLQLGFFSIVGIPMFKAMAELFEDAQPMLDGVLANYHHWQAATPDAALPS